MPQRKVKYKIRAYSGRYRSTLDTRVGSQGFQKLSFNKEHRATTALGEDSGVIKILTNAAKALIKKQHDENVFKNRDGISEPPFMAPSTNPDHYSEWCSVCTDFPDSMLVLCAGCRVGMCCTSLESSRGCVEWSVEIKSPDFIFYCHFCAKRLKKICPLKVVGPDVLDSAVWFRYDPPVLLIAITWHETQARFGEFLHKRLALSYRSRAEHILRLDIPLGGSGEDDGQNMDLDQLKDPEDAAKRFLKAYTMAKIVVVIDTHCLENGFFVWEGDSPTTYAACSLLEILRDCIPIEIFGYLSNSTGSPEHNHKSLILNLACGQSVNQEFARLSLLEGHCADAVLSLANRSTLVSEVASTLSEFTTKWIQTPSAYDRLITWTMKADWVKANQPVLSSHAQDHPHVIYTKFSIAEPYGQIVRCHLSDCKQRLEHKTLSNKVKYTCKTCNSTCHTDKVTSNQKTLLGKHELVKTPYPRKQYPTEWKLPPRKPDTATPPTTTATPPTTTETPPTTTETPPTTTETPPTTTEIRFLTVSPPSPISRTTSLPPASVPTPNSLHPGGALTIRIPVMRRSQSTSHMDDRRKAVAATPPPTPHPSVSTVKPIMHIADGYAPVEKPKRRTATNVGSSEQKRQKRK